MSLSVVVLVSVGQHPKSGRARLALEDARALALARTIKDASIAVLHAGQPDLAERALRDALGMGASELTLLAIEAQADPVPALIADLRQRAPDLVITGGRAEQGEGSGMMPFLMAEALGAPLVTGATRLEVAANRAIAEQAVAGGRRRRIGASLPLVVAVDEKAPPPALAAFGPAQRGRIAVEQAVSVPDPRQQWSARPARPRPKRLTAPNAAGVSTAQKQVLRDLDAETAAQAILTYLQQQDIVAAAASTERVS